MILESSSTSESLGNAVLANCNLRATADASDDVLCWLVLHPKTDLTQTGVVEGTYYQQLAIGPLLSIALTECECCQTCLLIADCN